MRKIALYLFALLLIFLVCFAFNTSSSMSANWFGPYLSAAANLTLGGEFLVDTTEVKIFNEMTPEMQEQYRFATSENAEFYNHNPIGWVYLIAAAKYILPWAPDLLAVELSQMLAHAFISVGILMLLKSSLHKLLFLFGYALNPVIVYYTGYPFYYFWQMWPAVGVFVLLGLNQGLIIKNTLTPLTILLIPYAIVLAIVFESRPTTLGMVLVFFSLLFYFRLFSLKIASFVVVAFVLTIGTIHQPNEKNPWHTVYVGLGAYPNETVEELSDNTGYALYEKVTGVRLNASIGGNYYDSKTIKRYTQISKDAAIKYCMEHSLNCIRNAALNTLQGFTIGYMTDKPYWLHLSMSFAGLLVIILLLISRQWLLIMSILMSLGTFVPFFPPIPAYMYGTYILLIYGLFRISDWVLTVRQITYTQNSHL